MPTLYGSDFAEVYSKYGYNQFSARVAELLPRVLRALHLTPDRVLDVPCGEGTFALEMARKGYLTTAWTDPPRCLEWPEAKPARPIRRSVSSNVTCAVCVSTMSS